MKTALSLYERKQFEKCPRCLNNMDYIEKDNQNYKGRCPVCKSVIFIKIIIGKETQIRIINN